MQQLKKPIQQPKKVMTAAVTSQTDGIIGPTGSLPGPFLGPPWVLGLWVLGPGALETNTAAKKTETAAKKTGTAA